MGGYNPVDQLFGSGTTEANLPGGSAPGMVNTLGLATTVSGGGVGGAGFSEETLRKISGEGGFKGMAGQALMGQRYTQRGGATGQQGFDVLSQYAESDDPILNLGQYMQSEFGIGQDYMKYLTPFQQERFGFMERGLGLEQQGFQRAGAQLGTKTGRGLRQATGQRDVATAQSGMAGVGGITKGFEQQKKDLFQDYSSGMEEIGLGMQKAQLGYETDVYGEKERQTERFYDDIKGIIQMKQGEGGDGGKK